MYDTVNLWLDVSMVGSGVLPTIYKSLSYVVVHEGERGCYHSGRYKDYYVSISEEGISLKGSLVKMHCGNNLHTLTRSGTQQAIEEMSDVLHLPLHEAKVTRFDFATHFATTQRPEYYYPYLGDKRYFERVQATRNTLYYNTGKRQLIFYDKIREAKKKGVTIPDVYTGSNLLRYEIRYTKDIPRQLNIAEVKASTLYNESFYMGIIDRWVSEYQSISKANKLSLKVTDNMITPKKAEEAILGLLLNREGPDAIDTIIRDFKAQGAFSDPKYYTRLKNNLRARVENNNYSERSELVEELDNHVKGIKDYYR